MDDGESSLQGSKKRTLDEMTPSQQAVEVDNESSKRMKIEE